MTNKTEWRMVPVEPTDKMVQAAHHIDLSYMPGQEGADRAAIYRAMLAAAPEVPAVARDKLKVLADEYAAQCSEFARKLASGKPDDSMSPIAVAAGDARMALHLAIDAAPEAPAQASAVDEREAFEAWVAKVQPTYWRAEAWQTEAWAMWQSISAALAQKGGQ